MAKLRKNAVVHSASGKFGDLIVFRQLADGSTRIAQAPSSNPNRVKSSGETANQKRFQRAIMYGQGAIADPELRKQYQEAADKKPLLSAYNVAVADFSKAPSIEQIDVSRYTGTPGDPIVITATDDFKVAEVRVVISDPDGTIVDEGMAMQDPSFKNVWQWVASKNNDLVKGDKIEVVATDIPGNITKAAEDLE